jgi:hypothetical protein
VPDRASTAQLARTGLGYPVLPQSTFSTSDALGGLVPCGTDGFT